MSVFEEINQIHFIGIGGIGMSSLARLFMAQGKTVTGSDQNESDLVKELMTEGAQIHIGHAALPEGTECVVYSEAIPEDNPERRAAVEMPLFNYFEALGEASRDYKVLAIAGTHGKTTTTAMLGFLLQEVGLDPTVIVGSKVPQFDNKNFRMGKSEWMVVEACEYRRNFLPLRPHVLGITNMELDHLDYFVDEADYNAAFSELEAQSESRIHAMDYWDPVGVPGRHNRENAGLAAAMARSIGVEDFSSLARFEGTWRRFQNKGEWNGATVIDDYAHHPTEITVTLQTAREEYPAKRVIAVFQPHQHSRTAAFVKEFAEALKLADLVVIPNIYATRDTEEDKLAMSEQNFIDELKEFGVNVEYPGSLEESVTFLDPLLSDQDLVLIMGAGDVNRILTLK